jgi:integrase
MSLGRDANGKRVRRKFYGKTKAEVQEKLDEAKGLQRRGRLPNPGQLTVGQWMAQWLEVKKRTTEPGTHSFYESRSRRLIVPHLGHELLGKLSADQVEYWFARMTDDETSTGEQRKAGVTLRAALDEAVRKNKLVRNVAKDVKLPKHEAPDLNVWNLSQTRAFLTSAKEDRLFALYVFVLDSGARQGEAFALWWDDIDFAKATVSITKNLEEICGRLRLKTTKTKESRRTVKLSESTIELLREHRHKMETEGHAEGCPVFCNREGGWLSKSNVLSDDFAPALKKSGVSRIRFYDLRHTCATLLLQAGISVKVVSERLGHKRIETTLTHYAHVLEGMQADAADAINKLLGTSVMGDIRGTDRLNKVG